MRVPRLRRLHRAHELRLFRPFRAFWEHFFELLEEPIKPYVIDGRSHHPHTPPSEPEGGVCAYASRRRGSSMVVPWVPRGVAPVAGRQGVAAWHEKGGTAAGVVTVAALHYKCTSRNLILGQMPSNSAEVIKLVTFAHKGPARLGAGLIEFRFL